MFIKAGDENVKVKASGGKRETELKVRLDEYKTGCTAGCSEGYIQEKNTKCKWNNLVPYMYVTYNTYHYHCVYNGKALLIIYLKSDVV